MKKHLQILLCLSLFASAACIAQPNFSAFDLNPAIGDQYIFKQSNFVNPGSAGANQTWNLSSMVALSMTAYTVASPASTPYAATFPNANIAIVSDSGIQYYNASSTVLQNYGDYSTGGTTDPYSNPEDMIRYPLTYNSSYSDTWQDQYISNGLTIVNADAYGTLTTPVGTYHNVLRVHYIRTMSDSTSSETDNLYYWYANNNHQPIAAVGTFKFTITEFSITDSVQAGYYLNNVVGIDEEAGLISSYSVSPDPAVDYLSLDIRLLSKQLMKVNVYNALGLMVRTSSFDGLQGDNRYRIDLSGLCAGIYFTQIALDDGTTDTRKFLITK